MWMIVMSLQIHFNVIHPHRPRAFKWFLSPIFFHQNFLQLLYIPYALCAPPFSFFFILSPKWHLVESEDHKSRHNLFLFLFTTNLSGPNIFLNILFLKNLRLCSILSVRDKVSQQYKTTGKIIVLFILIFIFLYSELEDTRFCSKW